MSGLVEREGSALTFLTLEILPSVNRDLKEPTISVVNNSRLRSTTPDASLTFSRSSRERLNVKIPTLEHLGEDLYVQKVEMDQKPDQGLIETIGGIYNL